MSAVSRFLKIKQSTLELIGRMLWRSVGLFALSLLGFAVVDYLVESGLADNTAMARRFPEFIPMMMAAAKFTLIEMSLFWIRIFTAPKLDVQGVLNGIQTWDNYNAVALVHLTNTLQWAFRVAVFIYLIG